MDQTGPDLTRPSSGGCDVSFLTNSNQALIPSVWGFPQLGSPAGHVCEFFHTPLVASPPTLCRRLGLTSLYLSAPSPGDTALESLCKEASLEPWEIHTALLDHTLETKCDTFLCFSFSFFFSQVGLRANQSHQWT